MVHSTREEPEKVESIFARPWTQKTMLGTMMSLVPNLHHPPIQAAKKKKFAEAESLVRYTNELFFYSMIILRLWPTIGSCWKAPVYMQNIVCSPFYKTSPAGSDPSSILFSGPSAASGSPQQAGEKNILLLEL